MLRPGTYGDAGFLRLASLYLETDIFLIPALERQQRTQLLATWSSELRKQPVLSCSISICPVIFNSFDQWQARAAYYKTASQENNKIFSSKLNFLQLKSQTLCVVFGYFQWEVWTPSSYLFKHTDMLSVWVEWEQAQSCSKLTCLPDDSSGGE